MKKKGPQDLTLRNLHAAVKRLDRLTHRVILQGQEILTLKGKVKALERQRTAKGLRYA